MSEPLSKIFQIERKEVQSAPHKFINTHEDYCEGYNQCVSDLDQLSPDVSVLAQKIKCYCTNTLQVDFSSYGAEKLSEEIINKMNEWVVKKG